VQFDLPGEGVYGVSLVATNGNGFGGVPPARGEAADAWIEVDLTKPDVQLLGVRPGTAEEGPGTVVISWKASDKNLGTTPIDLYYATQRGGPWQPIARGVKNDGSYRWTMPREAGPESYVRLTATDRAGNAATCDTTVDLTRPRARLVTITATPPKAAPTPGN
jgi:hypothetical protein